MKVMIFDVPAQKGGALTILNQYYCAAIKDKDTDWIFVVSTPELKEYTNIKILNYPWVKKSWFHRLYFDKFVANRIVKNFEVDEVLSLQNVIVPKVKVKQTLYLHQPLPFVDKRYSITENFKFWIYQNIISQMIFRSIKTADKVIVQTKWIRDVAIRKTQAEKEKFVLKQPELNIKVKKIYKLEQEKDVLFFFPASAMTYKNHEIIVQASKNLKNEGIKSYKVIFTLKGDENKNIKKLKEIVINERLPIEFVGLIDTDSVYEYYSKSILIFPSYIETFGLPLLEAKMHGSPIIASDCAFSHEILDGYSDVEFFDPFNSHQLFNLMSRHIQVI